MLESFQSAASMRWRFWHTAVSADKAESACFKAHSRTSFKKSEVVPLSRSGRLLLWLLRLSDRVSRRIFSMRAPAPTALTDSHALSAGLRAGTPVPMPKAHAHSGARVMSLRACMPAGGDRMVSEEGSWPSLHKLVGNWSRSLMSPRRGETATVLEEGQPEERRRIAPCARGHTERQVAESRTISGGPCTRTYTKLGGGSLLHPGLGDVMADNCHVEREVIGNGFRRRELAIPTQTGRELELFS
ncbi:hypothetical protein HAX54_032868 [Datura stramonium]|uniref:Uncharacterized protein n=1 Tax=Datura stramonium TaxID=4076 RepID=A0ABS8RLZ7_DATST|nr:hypothetical protein [Datura stramonium]